MARILIVGGGCRGRELGRAMGAQGHAIRITTRDEAGRAAIEASGAECWVGTPDRLATLREALAGVTVLCWLLGSAAGPEEQLRALHGSRLEFFLHQAIDTTVRGVVYEGAGSVPPAVLTEGERIVGELAARNAIPCELLRADPTDVPRWHSRAVAAVTSLLGSTSLSWR